MRDPNENNVVLVADDDMFVRKIIRKGLEGLADIVEVVDGAEVEEAYRENKPSMVFLDIHLPNQSGIELLPKIKAIDPQAYIVMLSADSSITNVKAAMGQGAKGFLTKPFERERMLKLFLACPLVTSTGG